MDQRTGSSGEYVLGHAAREQQRLIAQAALFRPSMELLLREASLGSGMRVLHAGCGAGDVAAIEACFHADAVWHLPGTGPLAGTHRGWPAIWDGLLAKQGPLSGGTFRARLFDLAIGDEFVVAVVHATADRDCRRTDQTVCQLMRVRDGRIAEIRGRYADQAALDAFWRGDEGEGP